MTIWTALHQAPLFMGFFRQEYWSGLPFPSLGIFPIQESNPGLLHYRQILYHLSHKTSFISARCPFFLFHTLELQLYFIPSFLYFHLFFIASTTVLINGLYILIWGNLYLFSFSFVNMIGSSSFKILHGFCSFYFCILVFDVTTNGLFLLHFIFFLFFLNIIWSLIQSTNIWALSMCLILLEMLRL